MVMQRARKDVFGSDAEREAYLAELAGWRRRWHVSFQAWCLLDDCVYLVVVTPGRPWVLGRLLAAANWRASRRARGRPGKPGRVFWRRFRSCAVAGGEHLLEAVRFVEQVPVDMHLAEKAEDWRWSSAKYHARGGRDRLVGRSRLPLGRERGWRRFLAEGVAWPVFKRIGRCIRAGRPYGPPSWVQALEEQLGRKLAPRKGGWPRGRPRKPRGP
jgi:putative transposase